jgi:hypothetical protein
MFSIASQPDADFGYLYICRSAAQNTSRKAFPHTIWFVERQVSWMTSAEKGREEAA